METQIKNLNSIDLNEFKNTALEALKAKQGRLQKEMTWFTDEKSGFTSAKAAALDGMSDHLNNAHGKLVDRVQDLNKAVVILNESDDGSPWGEINSSFPAALSFHLSRNGKEQAVKALFIKGEFNYYMGQSDGAMWILGTECHIGKMIISQLSKRRNPSENIRSIVLPQTAA